MAINEYYQRLYHQSEQLAGHLSGHLAGLSQVSQRMGYYDPCGNEAIENNKKESDVDEKLLLLLID